MNKTLSDIEKRFDLVFADLGGWCDPGPLRFLLEHNWWLGDRLVLGIVNSPGMNAAVTRALDGIYFVGISRGLFSGSFFGKTDHMIDRWTQLLKSSRTFNVYRDNNEFWMALRTSLGIFVQFHELGHISYGHLPESENSIVSIVETGVMAQFRSQTSKSKNHAIEVAADSHAALAYLPLMVTASSMSVETQFLSLTAGLVGLFFNYWAESDTHPHPSVRIACLYRFIEEAVLQSKLPESCRSGIKPAVELINRFIDEDANAIAEYLHYHGQRGLIHGISESDMTKKCKPILEHLMQGGLASPSIRVF